MTKLPKAVLYAVIAGVIGIFLAIFGFFRTLLIFVLVVLGFLVGNYLETRKNKEDQ